MKSRINNTASFDAENAESVQESGNVCVVSAILAYVINQHLWQSSIDLLEFVSRMRQEQTGCQKPWNRGST
jgi:hypothetical protein